MVLPDTLITNWKPDYVQVGGADTNAPHPTEALILEQELRELKSVIRQESVNKQWERWLGILSPGSPSPNPPGYLSPTQFTLTNDWTSAGTYYPAVAQIGRRVKALITGGFITGTITAASFAGGLTTVTVSWDSGSLNSGLTEVMFGSLTPTNGASPGLNMKRIVKPSDQAVTGTTLILDSALLFPMNANEKWYFKLVATLSWSSGVPASQFYSAIQVPTGATGFVAEPAGEVVFIQSGTGGMASRGVTPASMVLEGEVSNGANQGNLQFLYHPQVGSLTVTVQQGSFLIGIRMAP